MAQVPYDTGVSAEPFPTIAPRGAAPDDTLKVRATPEETGGLVAQGLEKAGAGVSTAAQFFGQVQTDHASTNAMKQAVDKLDQFRSLNGADALNNQQATKDEIDRIFADGREGLSTAEQQLKYDNTVRNFRLRYVDGVFASHADQQAKVFATSTNISRANLGFNLIAQNPDSDQIYNDNLAEVISARVKQVQLEGGDQPQVQAAVADAKAEAIATRGRAIAVKDPSGAMKFLDANRTAASVVDRRTGSTYYDTLANEFRQRATHQDGIGLQRQGLAQTYGNLPPAPAGSVTLPQISNAIEGQESNFGRNAATSITGAVGPRQIEPATFRQYAQPGEDIHNAKDSRAVGDRILADYYQKYGGDPYRVAVAYFSGPGNVAPAGSATPWVRNSADPNGKTVASYVSDIASRLGVSPGTPYAAEAANERYIMTSDAPDEVKQYALAENGRFFREAAIAAEADSKAKADANHAASMEYLTNWISAGTATPASIQKMNTDSRITDPKIKEDLLRIASTQFGYDNPAQYGDAYPELYRRIMLPPGDPQRINSLHDILAAGQPGGGLRLPGLRTLISVWNDNQKNPDAVAVNQTKSSLMQYAKQKLSFDQETLAPGFQLRDPKGAQVFNAQFVPKFEAAYEKWTKDGKDPWQFLTQENIDKLMVGMRPKSQMQADRIGAVADLAGEKLESVPPPQAPAGANVEAYRTLMQRLPVMRSGRQATPEQYGSAINLLVDLVTKNPSDANNVKQKFNNIFGAEGAMADDVLGKLGIAAVGTPRAKAAVPSVSVASPAAPGPSSTSSAPAAPAAPTEEGPAPATLAAPAGSLSTPLASDVIAHAERQEELERASAHTAREEQATQVATKLRNETDARRAFAGIGSGPPLGPEALQAIADHAASRAAQARERLAQLDLEENRLLQEVSREVGGHRVAAPTPGLGHTPAYIAAALKRIEAERKALGGR